MFDRAKPDERGQLDAGRLVKASVYLVIGLTVFALVAALLAPVALDAVNDDDTVDVTQNVGETTGVVSNVDSTLDATDTTGDNATYTVSGPDSSVTHTVDNGTSQDFSLDGGTVTVTVNDVNSGSATSTFTVPSDFGWSGGATGLWGIMDVIITLALLLFAIGLALHGVNRV